VVTFRSEIGQEDLAGIKTHFPRLKRSTTTEVQYRRAVSSFEKHPDPRGTMLHWVCRPGPSRIPGPLQGPLGAYPGWAGLRMTLMSVFCSVTARTRCTSRSGESKLRDDAKPLESVLR
jgi:hypothetical protein